MEISDEYQDMGNPGGGVAIANMPMHHRQTPDSSESHQEEESDPDQDEESGEELPQQPLQNNTHLSENTSGNIGGAPLPVPSHIGNFLNPHFLSKLKQEPSEVDMMNSKSNLDAIHAAMTNGYPGFPFPAPFLQLQHLNPGQNRDAAAGNALVSSASSHSSESSQSSSRNNNDPRDNGQSNMNNNNSANSGQQPSSWSFEEQFKQVRQMLYEINDDPKRKEFLDDLFSFMQKRGTPINRLPIMAKSVLDLYELYNLVIARGGLVDVINKKLWQEIIKGLHLPSSITSAAFTLRTQYMKYLYPYECEKRRLSTPAELQAAIDGNRREGRRSSYGAYGGGSGDNMISRTPSTPGSLALHAQMSPLSLVSALGQHHGAQAIANGSTAHTPLPYHPHHPQHQQAAGLMAGGPPADFDARVTDYLKMLHRDFHRGTGATSPPMTLKHQGSPEDTPPRDTREALMEMSKLTLWNMYNPLYGGLAQPPVSPQTSHSPHPQSTSPEPQREALDLGLRTSPTSTSPLRHSSPSSGGSLQVKKDRDSHDPSAFISHKRTLSEDEGPHEKIPALPGTHIKISNRGDGRNGDNSLAVSMEINGMMYQGVLYAQSDNNNKSISMNNNNNKTRSLVS
ncbi:protein dead ringer isoform X3 [Cotesia glomerata]|uniref:protein dead ringer isoform X3 n=1 Tax=Cotesia glomerata TaxID=32391 RepID=UPI001D022DDB|nr:protein dead ringer isoform X3 [Cotesia glomerata]